MLARRFKPAPRPLGSPGWRLNRVDHWLYDRYQLGVLGRSQVRAAVLGGKELRGPLREAARALATAMLAGQIGGLYRRAGWIVIGSGVLIISTTVVAAVVSDDYVVILAAAVGLPQLARGVVLQTKISKGIRQACQLNQPPAAQQTGSRLSQDGAE